MLPNAISEGSYRAQAFSFGIKHDLRSKLANLITEPSL